jgi:hypothetical protein
MFCTVSLPRKWSMRKTWLSSTRATRPLSSRAEVRSWPKGFSTTTRVQGTRLASVMKPPVLRP